MYQTTLVQMENGDVVDLVKSINQKRLVVVTPSSLYGLAPRSDLIKMQDGTLVSFMETLVNALNSSGGSGGTITTDFIKDLELNNSVIVVTKSDGSTINLDLTQEIDTAVQSAVSKVSPVFFYNLVYGISEEIDGYFELDGNITQDTSFRRMKIPVTVGKTYRISSTLFTDIKDEYTFFDSNGNTVGNGGIWGVVNTLKNGVSYREVDGVIPTGVSYIGISYIENAKNLMLWDSEIDPYDTGYTENKSIVGFSFITDEKSENKTIYDDVKTNIEDVVSGEVVNTYSGYFGPMWGEKKDNDASSDWSSYNFSAIDSNVQAGYNKFQLSNDGNLRKDTQITMTYSHNQDSTKKITGILFDGNSLTLSLNTNSLDLSLPARAQYPIKFQNIQFETKDNGEGHNIYGNGTPIVIGDNVTFNKSIDIYGFLAGIDNLNLTNTTGLTNYKELNTSKSSYINIQGSAVTNVYGGSGEGITDQVIKKAYIKVTDSGSVTGTVYLTGKASTETIKEAELGITTTGNVSTLAKGDGSVEKVTGTIDVSKIGNFDTSLNDVMFDKFILQVPNGDTSSEQKALEFVKNNTNVESSFKFEFI